MHIRRALMTGCAALSCVVASCQNGTDVEGEPIVVGRAYAALYSPHPDGELSTIAVDSLTWRADWQSETDSVGLYVDDDTELFVDGVRRNRSIRVSPGDLVHAWVGGPEDRSRPVGMGALRVEIFTNE